MEFEEILSSDLLKLRWLMDKKSIMSNEEKLLFDFLITQRPLSYYQQELLTEMYDRIKKEFEAPIKFKSGVYQIEINESCGYSNAI